MAFERAGQAKMLGRRAREAEALVVRLVAHEQHGAMAELDRAGKCSAHQGRANAAATIGEVDRKRSKQQRRPIGSGGNAPKPQRADEAAGFRARGKRQAFRGQPPVA